VSSQLWYFGEGATNVFSLFFLLENPAATPANVTLTHLLEGGAPPVSYSIPVPPATRRTVFVNDVPGLATAALSTIVSSDVPIVAERAMYANTTDRLWEGGTAGGGATILSTTWSFAEGSTGFFHTYLLLGNPAGSPAAVTVQYRLPTGDVITRSYDVAPQARRTIDVNVEVPELGSTSFAMSITSTQPIAAERAMWWETYPWTEGSNSIGAMETGTVWGIGEAAEGGALEASTFALVANASATAGTVRFTVVPLAGNARLTVRIADGFPRALGQRFSVLVESLTAGVPITVEYARYLSSTSFLDGGGAAVATRIR
jgi:hypothetical protein